MKKQIDFVHYLDKKSKGKKIIYLKLKRWEKIKYNWHKVHFIFGNFFFFFWYKERAKPKTFIFPYQFTSSYVNFFLYPHFVFPTILEKIKVYLVYVSIFCFKFSKFPVFFTELWNSYAIWCEKQTHELHENALCPHPPSFPFLIVKGFLININIKTKISK